MPVNGIKLAAGQKWKTKNYGVVKLSDSGVNSNYPWRMNFPNNGDPIGSITTDGKYWEDDDDEMPELLECIYNPEDKGEPRYTLQEIKEAWDASGWVRSTYAWEAFQKNLTKINSPEYQEYLRLKAIYE